jgi:hypothetical protein
MDYVKTFINHLAKKESEQIQDFAKKYYSENYQLLKQAITNPNSLKVEDKERLSEICTDDSFISNVLLQNESETDLFKSLIAYDFMGNKTNNMTDEERYNLAVNLLKHCKGVAPLTSCLVISDFDACFNHLTRHVPTVEDPSPFPSSTTNELCEYILRELDKPEISEKFLKITPFKCIDDKEGIKMCKFIKSHMPSNMEFAEHLAMQLISNPNINEKFKNELFEEYGYDISQPLKNITPYIINTLYKSAIDGFDYINFSNKENIFSLSPIILLQNAMLNKALTPSLELDLSNRLLEILEKNENRQVKQLLAFLIKDTENTQVLQNALEKTNDIYITGTVYGNSYAPKDLLKETASACCDAFDIETSSIEQQCIWTKIKLISTQTELYDKDYKILLKNKDSVILKHLLQSPTTPEKIISEIVNILNEKNPYMMMAYLLRNKLLEQQPLSPKETLFILEKVPDSLMSYCNNGKVDLLEIYPFKKMTISNPSFMNNLQKTLQELLKEKQVQFKEVDYDNYIKEINEYIQEGHTTQKEDEIRSNLNDFYAEIEKQTPVVFTNLEDIAYQYCKLQQQELQHTYSKQQSVKKDGYIWYNLSNNPLHFDETQLF